LIPSYLVQLFDGIFFSTRTSINATPDAIWRLLTDAARYPSWNSTVDRVDGRIALGETVTVQAYQGRVAVRVDLSAATMIILANNYARILAPSETNSVG